MKTKKQKQYNFIDSMFLGVISFAMVAFMTMGVHKYVKAEAELGWGLALLATISLVYYFQLLFRLHIKKI